jgi:hypothetical protein
MEENGDMLVAATRRGEDRRWEFFVLDDAV